METEPNIFEFAYGELSQDGFLEYFLTFGKEKYKNSKVFERVQYFLKECGIPEEKSEKEEVIKEIKRQFHHIDVFVQTENFYLIIEDKTGTNEHNDQIYEYYKELVSEEKYDPKKIKICYFKTMDYLRDYIPPKRKENDIILEENQCVSFNRESILKLFEPIKNENLIFESYYNHLLNYTKKGNYLDKTINDWNKECWFNFLKEKLISKTDSGIGYVPRISGSFYGAWFDYSEDKKGISKEKGLPFHWYYYKQIEITIKDEHTENVRLCKKAGIKWDEKETKEKPKCTTKLIESEIKELQKIHKTSKNYKQSNRRNGRTTTYLYHEIDNINQKRAEDISDEISAFFTEKY